MCFLWRAPTGIYVDVVFRADTWVCPYGVVFSVSCFLNFFRRGVRVLFGGFAFFSLVFISSSESFMFRILFGMFISMMSLFLMAARGPFR